MKLRVTLVALTGGLTLLALTACTQLSTFLGKFQPPCTVEESMPARMFAFEAPETAVAQAPFTVVAWVSLSGDYHDYQVPIPQSFGADVDPAAKTITLSGQVRADVANPEADCVLPMGMPAPKGATMSIRVSAPAGTYTLRIAEQAFTPVKPINPPSLGGALPNGYPEPLATRSITIE